MWNVLHTKPRAEKKVTESLKNIGVDVYCPTVIEVRQWSDRKKKISKPLHKLIFGDEEDLINYKETNKDELMDEDSDVD